MTITPNVAETAAAMVQFGFVVTPPSPHETGAWINRNIEFANGYWELLEVHQANEQTMPLLNAAALRRGLHGICLASTDIYASVARMRDAGLLMSKPSHFSRVVENDGPPQKLSFCIAHCLDAPDGLLLFFCQRTSGAYGLASSQAGHRNGVLAINSLVLTSRKPEVCARYLARLFESEMRSTGSGFAIDTPDQCIEVMHSIGGVSHSVSALSDPVEVIVRLSRRGSTFDREFAEISEGLLIELIG